MTLYTSPINVTRTFLPSREAFAHYLDTVWETARLTNHGSLEIELCERIKAYTETENVVLCANGTLALQLALRACRAAGGEIITTPFTYAATANAIIWEGARPVFADIEYESLSPTAESVEKCLTAQTRGILMVHVFGYPAHVEELEALAATRGVPLIFDAAHCFGVIYKGKSLLQYGDVSACSFHATKAFHCAEGGGVFCRSGDMARQIGAYAQFGLDDGRLALGINAKLSELHAAMGLAVLPHMGEILAARQKRHEYYNRLLPLGRIRGLKMPEGLERHNYGYYPVVMEHEDQLLRLQKNLALKNIFPRRYFSPSLDTMPHLASQNVCPVSRDIASRILCLPMYHDLPFSVIQDVAESLNDVLLAGAGGHGLREAWERGDTGRGVSSAAERRPARPSAAPEVCVLTTAYNHEKYIEECIQSVAAQEGDFLMEHIIGDDASSDRTAEIINDYASKYRHIRPFLQKERTYGRGNVETLFQAVRSPYVSICEGDDFFIDPGKLRKQLAALDQNPKAAVCAHPVEVLFQETGRKEIFPDLEHFRFMRGRNVFGLEDIIKANFIQTNSVVYRWRFGGGLPPWFNYYVMPQDWYWHILHAETGSILYLPEAMSCYRRHAEGLWSVAPSRRAHTLKWAYPKLRFYQTLEAHFKGRFRKIFELEMFSIYSELYDRWANNDPSALNFYDDFFPEAAEAFNYPATLKLKRKRIKKQIKTFFGRCVR